MSTRKLVLAAVAASFVLISAFPAVAKPSAKPPKVKPAAAKANTVKPTTVHGHKNTTASRSSAATAHGSAKALKPPKGQPKSTTTADFAKATGPKVKGDKASRQAHNDLATRPNQDDVVLGTPTGPIPLSKAQQQLLKNDHLRAKMAARLGGNIDPVVAAGSFKNLGQFVAAVNVSRNQGVDFKALRQLMSGPQQMSLGQALQKLKHVDARTANAAVDTATTTADRDIAASADATTAKQKTKRNGRG